MFNSVSAYLVKDVPIFVYMYVYVMQDLERRIRGYKKRDPSFTHKFSYQILVNKKLMCFH